MKTGACIACIILTVLFSGGCRNCAIAIWRSAAACGGTNTLTNTVTDGADIQADAGALR